MIPFGLGNQRVMKSTGARHFALANRAEQTPNSGHAQFVSAPTRSYRLESAKPGPHGARHAMSLLDRWQSIPLYARIMVAVAVGLVVGVVLGPRASVLGIPARLVLRILAHWRRL